MSLIPLSRVEDAERSAAFDVRGWEVRTELDNEQVGEVDDVLMDGSGRPRYLDIDLGPFRKHVLMPIGQARADGRRDVVWVPGMTRDQLRDIPHYDHDPARVDRDYEDRLASAYAASGERAPVEEETRGDREALPELAALDRLDDYKVADGDVNPKGWDVVAADGRDIGEVDQLLVDTQAMKVRYLAVDLDGSKLGLGDHDRQILVPTGYATLDRDDKKVILDVITSSEVGDLPVYGGLPLPRNFERDLSDAFQRGHRPSDRYSQPVYDADRFWGERRGVEGGRPLETQGDRVYEAVEEPVDERSAELRDAYPDRRERIEEEPPREPDRDREERAASESSTRLDENHEVRIRVRGDEIIVERKRIED